MYPRYNNEQSSLRKIRIHIINGLLELITNKDNTSIHSVFEIFYVVHDSWPILIKEMYKSHFTDVWSKG